MAFDPESLRCVDALPVRLIESSRGLWTSALVEHHQVLDSDDPFETVATSDQTLVVMTRGEQRLQAHRDGVWRSTLYRPGTVGVTPAGGVSRLRREINREAGPARKVNLYVPSAAFEEAADALGAPFRRDQPLLRPPISDEAIRNVALALIGALRRGFPDLYVESAIGFLASHLLVVAREPMSERAIDTRGDRRIRRVLEAIEHRYAEPLSLADLASEAGVSKHHFVRLFRASLGVSPYRFVIRVRLEAARRLLVDTALPISEIARRCGFPRANHFATEFSRTFGATPSDFRLGTSNILRS